MKKGMNRTDTEKTFLLSEYGKRKLTGYAASFQEIARTLERTEIWQKEAEEKEAEAGGQEKDAGQQEEERRSRLYRKGLSENRGIFARNLSEMAEIMAKVAGEVFSYRPFPVQKSKLIIQAMKREGITVRDLYYIEKKEGRLRISLTMETDRAGGILTEDAAALLSVLLNERLLPAESCSCRIDSGARNYIFTEEPRFVVMTGAARAIKENEEKSGDNYAILETERGKLTLLISDGMGSGEKACEDSETVLDLMEKLVEAGYSPKTAARLINGVLLLGGSEQNMSTLDICELDLYNGICEFTKIGAAASFIKRGHMVEQISTGTLPLGILKEMKSESICRRLMDGDYVFLLSDGVSDAVEECDYKEDLCELIGSLEQENPRELAEALFRTVLRKTRGRIRDDMTILVLGIWDNV